MSTNSRRTFGAILLIAGCCIGAGMLGLPLVIARAGFISSSVAFIVCWLFMTATGLLLLEANSWFGQGIHLMTLAEKTLGKWAKGFVTLSFGFLFYCLLVAYLTGGGQLVSECLEHFFGINIEPFTGSLALVLIFGMVIYFGTAVTDLVNRLLMLGLVGAYLGLVCLSIPHIQGENLKGNSWIYALPALPAMIISFGFHNLIPSLNTYLKGDKRSLCYVIVIGSAIPLLFYLIWDGIIIGMTGILNSTDSNTMITGLLKETVGSSYVVDFMHLFALFALVTSLLGVALSFVDFLADGMKIKKDSLGSFLLVSLVLIPPSFFAYLYPSLFLTALTYAGAFGAVLLFGIIPILMVAKGRYWDKRRDQRLLPGGIVSLALLGLFALFIFFMQLFNELEL